MGDLLGFIDLIGDFFASLLIVFFEVCGDCDAERKGSATKGKLGENKETEISEKLGKGTETRRKR